jgi:D-alanine-D-alanine ligase
MFVKPANLGSSVGISKAHDREELGPAIDLAANYDRKIVIEQGVGGAKGKARELEVAVLGNEAPEASVVGEIVPGKEFYDYEAKYLSDASVPIIPAKITRSQSKRIREMAIAAFRACDCTGLARVDFLMEPESKKASADLCERGEYAAGVHQDQYVSEALGGIGSSLFAVDRPADRVGVAAAG